MSIPQKMLMIQPTMMTVVRSWMRAAATLSQNTQHTPRSEIRSLRAPHSTANAEMRVPAWGGGATSWLAGGETLHSSMDISKERKVRKGKLCLFLMFSHPWTLKF